MKIRLLVLMMVCTGYAQANTLYKCTDNAGHSTYTNFKAQNRNCTILSREAPAMPGGSKPARTTKSATPSPADFPKVSAETQKSRDTDRRQIVEQELNNEQKNLSEAKKTLATQEATRAPQELLKSFRDRIALHERNLVELQRELSRLR
jgi:hypothetical protein